MNRLSVMVVGCFAVATSGCHLAVFFAGVPGSGVLTTEYRETQDFQSIKLSGAGELNIVCGQSTSVSVLADDNLQELIQTVVDGQMLRIWNEENINPSETPVYDILTEELTAVSVNGSSRVNVSDFDGEDFQFHVSGSGRIKIVGRTESVSINISGSGRADLSELEANDVSITVSGSGRANVIAREKLDVAISGSGRVDYVGEPAVTQRISGSGRISKTTSKAAKRKVQENNEQRDDSSEEDDVDEELELEGDG